MTVSLQNSPLEPGALLAAFAKDRSITGAVVTFTGLARADAGPETRLELEAYPGFTEREISRIADDATARFALQDVMIVHRTGSIAPGEAIVFVAAAAAHRREAFEAADFLMDYLKSRAPFWKKEAGPDGARWVEPTARDQADVARWDVDG